MKENMGKSMNTEEAETLVELTNKIIDHCNKFIDDYQNNKTA